MDISSTAGYALIVKYLQIFNWAALIAGGMMTLVLAVVSLMLLFYQQEAAEVGSRLAPVLASTAAFGVLAVAAAVAIWAVRGDSAWKWPAQAGVITAVFCLVRFIQQIG